MSRKGRYPTWFAIPVGIGVFIVVLGLWQALIARETAQIERKIQLQSTIVRNLVASRIESRVQTLVRMADSWEQQDVIPRQEWETEAWLTVRHNPDYRAIGWVDPTLHLRWVVPLLGNEGLQDLSLESEGRLLSALARAQSQREVTMSHPVQMEEGRRGFFVFIPIFHGKDFGGWIAGIFQTDELLGQLLPDQVSPGYSIALSDQKETIFRRDQAGKKYEKQWGQEEPIPLYGVTWRARVWPGPAMLVEEKSVLPEVVLGSGILFSFLLGIAVHLAQTSRRRARDLEAANQELRVKGQQMQSLLEDLHASREQLQAKSQYLQEAYRQLERAAILKDELIAKVSHELRTPLTTIKEGVSLMLDQALGTINEEQKDFLQTMDQNVDRLTELITNLLDFSKIREGRLRLVRRRVDIGGLIQATLKQYRLIAGQRTLETVMPAVPPVFADPNRILQVLGNLFSNAVKFTDDNGVIRFGLQQQDGYVNVVVQDNGRGIAREDIGKLFQQFSQVGDDAAKHRGTGLGLALCKELVELHRGSIWVTSEPGKGSQFTFTLPVYTSEFVLEESFSDLLEMAQDRQENAIGLIAFDGVPLLEEASGSQEQRRRILEEMGEFFRTHIHRGDLVLCLEPRWVVALAIVDPLGLEAIAQRIRTAVEEWAGKRLRSPGPLPLKFGMANFPADGSDGATLFAKAREVVR